VSVSASGFEPTERIVTVVADQISARDYFLTPKVGTIRGIVRNATTNAPIAGAVVTTGSITAITGSDGAYTLNNVSAGAQTLSVTADGFNPATVSGNVPPGQTVNQDFALTPLLGTVTGIVRDDFNEPIAGATVTAAGITTTSGADGSYTLANLPVGAQTISGSATELSFRVGNGHSPRQSDGAARPHAPAPDGHNPGQGHQRGDRSADKWR
jgi:hypothetical protein